MTAVSSTFGESLLRLNLVVDSVASERHPLRPSRNKVSVSVADLRAVLDGIESLKALPQAIADLPNCNICGGKVDLSAAIKPTVSFARNRP